MKKLEKWKTLRSEMVFDHRWYKVRKDEVQLPNGRILDDYYVSVRPEVVLVFPITADNEVIMVRQYKHGAGQILLELPGGIVDTTDSSVEVAAKRELLEETGYYSEQWTKLAVIYDDPTKNTNQFHFYLAEGAYHTREQKLDHTEDIIVEKVPLAEVMHKAVQGEICVANSLAIILLALEKIKQNKLTP
ncbi:NUDIX hydrolase [Cytophagaceae bacterium DM2B3-1]|uniref:GDP-mannose pyrophosphatase n=1 Tax=Xanthocytophaga flava TaxID=3048013 RepID=A0ABT7CLX0_9BACT|nr:NUDIX hydrolase [Xanthocytophaga flavus]MDJ1494744.1 NUDIX hydrolase [Xanthocytophaga flavus]